MPTILPYCIQYAVSNHQNLCKKCLKVIPQDSILIGIMQQSIFDDCLKPEWYDMSCFFKTRQPISEDNIEGFANLRYNHQMEIRSNLGFDAIGTSTSEQSPETEFNNSELETQIEIQNKEFFKIFNKLKSIVEYDDLLDILKENNQFVPESFIDTLNHVCDIIYFGALTPCSVCKEGKFVFRNSGYCCTGYDSAWSSCVNTVKEPKRIPVILPEKYQKILGTDFQVRTRILREVTEFNPDEFDIYTKQPLFGMEFFIFGKTTMPREDIENRIKAMGGKIASRIYKNVAAVISNVDEVKAYTEMMQHAFSHRIQVIPDDFLNEVMANDPFEVIIKKDLSKWGKDPYERLPEQEKTSQPCKSNDCSKGNYYRFDLNTGDRCDGIVYWKDNLAYEAVLSFVDISTYKNSYFKLQLQILRHESSKYAVSESIGRIGTSIGTTKQEKYTTLDEAQSAFKKIYMKKTGNEFGSKMFVKKPGLYNLVNIDNETLKKELRNSQTNAPSTNLSKQLYELMELLYSDNQVLKSTLIAYCFDLDSMPLGKLGNAQIQEALNLLGEISSLQNSENMNRIVAASNQFYSTFPHYFGLRRPPVINTPKMIQEKMDLLQYLLQKELRYEFLISESNQEKNLLDLCYEQLEDSAEIKMLNKASGMYTQICDYIKNTQLHEKSKLHYYDPGHIEVDEIFEVLRHEELMRYAPYEKNFNRQLLFHGTRIRNLVGILTNGLKVAPPEAIFTGSVFGKGIYFSDSVSKSAKYCRARDGVGLVLLCEVAAGITDVRYKTDNSKLTDRCETIQALGQYYPHPLHIRPDGLKIPNGTLIRRNEETGILFNEFVVTDESRVKIRYLVKLKFSPFSQMNR